jgi:glutaredoxin-like protein
MEATLAVPRPVAGLNNQDARAAPGNPGRRSLAGSRVPNAELAELRDAKVQRTQSAALFRGRRVVMFALPGAFTPTCSTEHVPGYLSLLAEFSRQGIAEVVCLSVNDPYVMDAWQRAEKAQGLRFVSDPYGEFTRAMGMSVDNRDASLGVRSWRYSMLVDDGKIETMFIEPDEPGDPFGVSSAETMMKYLQPDYKVANPAFMMARHGCPHCARAKELLRSRGIAFEAVHLGEGLTMRGVKAASGTATVPQVFIEGKLVGGASQLEEYLSGETSAFAGASPPDSATAISVQI